MSACTKNKKNEMAFAEHSDKGLERANLLVMRNGLAIEAASYSMWGLPLLTIKQWRKLANRILTWCDAIDKEAQADE